MSNPEHPRKPSTALGWFPHSAATEAAIIDMANSRQIAFRLRLRNHYWLTEGKPLGATTIALIRKKMAMIDARDKMTDAQAAEVLTDHYGFTSTADGWVIPDLDAARGVALGSLQSLQRRASAGGLARAAKASAARESIDPDTGEIKANSRADF